MAASPSVQQYKSKTWSRDGFIVSTDPSLISLKDLTAAFNDPAIYWAQELPEDVMREMIANSLCFGLYTPTPVPHTDSTSGSPSTATSESDAGPRQIGFARCITDYVTFLYLTDVYVLDEWQGHGLGSWMIQCVQEVVESMPHLRRTLLLTSNDGAQGIGMYERRMKMSRIGNGARRGSIVERIGQLASVTSTDSAKDLLVMSAKGPGALV